MNIKELADSLLESMRGYVAKNVADLSERMESLAKRLDEMPAPKDGIDGKDGAPGVDGKDGKDGIDGKDGANGVDGKDGSDGKDGESIKGEPGENGKDGIDGKDGRDGVDGQNGEHGRDALDIDILRTINEEKRYARGTFATHKGGLWVSRRTTDGMDGWECIVRGWDLPEVIQDDEDPRVIKMVMRSSDGECVEKSLRIPFVMDKGVFKEGNDYQAGDGVTWAGSYWIAKQDTTSKPDGGEYWRLAVKKGRDATANAVKIGGLQ